MFALASRCSPGARGRRGVPWALAIACAWVAISRPAMADPPPKAVEPPPQAADPWVPGSTEAKEQSARAMALFREAREAYERGEYRTALTELTAAISLDAAAPELVYDLALVHEKLGELDEAENEFNRYLRLETDAKQRERVQGILKRLEGAKKDLHDRHDAAPAAPPPLAATSTLAPRHAPPPSAAGQNGAHAVSGGRSPWVFAFAGTAAGALAVGGAFAISAVALKPGSNATTGDGVAYADLQDDAASAHRRAIMADLSFALAACTGAVAVYLEITGRRPKATAPPAAVAFVPEGATFGVRF